MSESLSSFLQWLQQAQVDSRISPEFAQEVHDKFDELACENQRLQDELDALKTSIASARASALGVLYQAEQEREQERMDEAMRESEVSDEIERLEAKNTDLLKVFHNLDIHQRRCHDCGNVAWHKMRFIPHVNCFVCGSQDTREIRKRGNDE